MNKDKKFLFIFTIIFFIIFIVLLSFIIFKNNKMQEKWTFFWNIFTWNLETIKDEVLSITLIEDKRNPETDLTWFIENLKINIPYISTAKIKKLDFSDSSVKEYLQKNNINNLPAIIFSKKDFDSVWENINDEIDIKKYLIQLNSGEFLLNIDANIYNPFTASARGFSTINRWLLENIKNDSFFMSDKNKKIIWLDYGDLACSYCKNFHKSWVIEEVLNLYDEEVTKTYNHLKVHDWKHFEVLECAADQKWEEWFFKFLKIFYEDWAYDLEWLKLRLAKWLYDLEKLDDCLLNWNKTEKVNMQSERAIWVFWIKSTPTSVFINTETLEYKIVSWFTESLWKEPYIKAIESLK